MFRVFKCQHHLFANCPHRKLRDSNKSFSGFQKGVFFKIGTLASQHFGLLRTDIDKIINPLQALF